MSQPSLETIKTNTQSVYDRHADKWSEVRLTTLFEEPWLKRFTEVLPAKASLLDVGCGTGKPLAEYFLDAGFDITGIDYAAGMIQRAVAELPSADWQVADMRALNLGRQFPGVYSWDAVFHLSVDEQRAALPVLCDHVATGGALLFNAGAEEGEVSGTVCDESVYHASLNIQEYEDILRSCGFRQVEYVIDDPAVLHRTVILAWNRHVDLR
ncbi:MAG: class I SAM-dependent methyltransferase [Pseudomonadota bacterium]